jgi:hypothetical protein
MSEQVKAITKHTLIPISLAIVIMGGTSWITTMYNRIDVVSQFTIEIAAQMKEMRTENIEQFKEMRKDSQELRDRLIRIEAKK